MSRSGMHQALETPTSPVLGFAARLQQLIDDYQALRLNRADFAWKLRHMGIDERRIAEMLFGHDRIFASGRERDDTERCIECGAVNDEHPGDCGAIN